MHNEISIWVTAYAIFWVIFNGYFSVKNIIKLTTDKKIRDDKNEKIIEDLDNSISELVAMTSTKVLALIVAIILVLVFALDMLGYLLIYAYVQLEGLKLIALYVAFALVILYNIVRIVELSQVIKKLRLDVSKKEIVKFMRGKTIDKTIYTLVISVINLYFALQLVLWCLF